MTFALNHDDGQSTWGINDADVVLVGVSRTSKTPTCIYLANRGIKAANVPIVPGVTLPPELAAATRPLIVGLTNDPERLIQVRRNRLSMLHQDESTDYTDIEAVRGEVAQARRYFAQNHWPVIDVSRRSIEETAAAILKLLARRHGTEERERADPRPRLGQRGARRAAAPRRRRLHRRPGRDRRGRDQGRVSRRAPRRRRMRQCARRGEGAARRPPPSRCPGHRRRPDAGLRRRLVRQARDRARRRAPSSSPCAASATSWSRRSAVVRDGERLWHFVDRSALIMRDFSDAFLDAYLDARRRGRPRLGRRLSARRRSACSSSRGSRATTSPSSACRCCRCSISCAATGSCAMTLTGKARKAGVMGWPVGHSRSPALHG